MASEDELLVLTSPASEAGILSFTGGSSGASNMKDHDEHLFQ
jgi:hypothetical protein